MIIKGLRVEDIQSQIIEKHKEAERLVSDAGKNAMAAVVSAYECGQLLNRAKAIIKHGEWLGYIHGLGMKPMTVSRYMRLAKYTGVINLSKYSTLTEAYRAVGLLPDKPESDETPGTAEVDIALSLTDKLTKRVDSLGRLIDGIRIEELPQDGKEAISQAIAKVNEIGARLGLPPHTPQGIY